MRIFDLWLLSAHFGYFDAYIILKINYEDTLYCTLDKNSAIGLTIVINKIIFIVSHRHIVTLLPVLVYQSLSVSEWWLHFYHIGSHCYIIASLLHCYKSLFTSACLLVIVSQWVMVTLFQLGTRVTVTSSSVGTANVSLYRRNATDMRNVSTARTSLTAAVSLVIVHGLSVR